MQPTELLSSAICMHDNDIHFPPVLQYLHTNCIELSIQFGEGEGRPTYFDMPFIVLIIKFSLAFIGHGAFV